MRTLIGPLFLWEKLVLGQAGVSPLDEAGVLRSFGAGSFCALSSFRVLMSVTLVCLDGDGGHLGSSHASPEDMPPGALGTSHVQM